MSAKIQKLERQFTDETPAEIVRQGSSSSIFKGVAIFVNGYTGQFAASASSLNIVFSLIESLCG